MVFSLFSWMTAVLSAVRPRSQDSNAGQGLVEYALILVLVAVVVIVILSIVGGAIANQLYRNIIDNL